MSKKDNKNTDDLIGQLCDGLDKKCGDFCVIRKILPWAIISIVYAVIVSFYSGLRYDFADVMHEQNFLFEVGLAFTIFAASALSSAYLTVPDQGQQKWIKIVPLTLVGVFLLWSIIRVYIEGFYMPSFTGLHCAERGAYIELLPILAIVILSTRGHTTQPYWLISMNVLSVMALGWIGLRLTCSMDGMDHSYIFHLLPFGVAGAVLAFFARKLFKW